jgi:hypothetical protein
LFQDEKAEAAKALPGVKLHVLGPPTAAQSPNVVNQRPENKEQYWLRAKHNAEMAGARAEPLFPGYDLKSVPAYARWTKKKLSRLRKDMLFSLTRALDDAMNNTSLILLFQVGDKAFLFPGDAQWENWEYALGIERYVKLLRSVDVYKVGHHGSRNATPKKLWELLDQKSADENKPNRLISVLSTKKDVHGDTVETAVPQGKLVEELAQHSHFHTTEALPDGQLFDEIALF